MWMKEKKSRNMTLRRVAALLIALVIACLLPIACKPDGGTPDGGTPAEPSAPVISRPERVWREAPRFSVDELMTEDEIEAFAAYLAYEAARPEVVRPGGYPDLDALERVTLIRVVDGDTLMVDRDGEEVRLRLIGIDAPESFANHDESRHTIAGENVSRIVKAWLDPGIALWLEYDEETTDQYDRLLAYAYLNDCAMINEILAEQGLAEVRRYEPNVRFHDYLDALQRLARKQRLGMWSGED